jgi:hypothetical protein
MTEHDDTDPIKETFDGIVNGIEFDYLRDAWPETAGDDGLARAFEEGRQRTGSSLYQLLEDTIALVPRGHSRGRSILGALRVLSDALVLAAYWMLAEGEDSDEPDDES